MRWKATYTKSNYAPGTTRLARRRAWLPTYIGGDMVWLEVYEVLQFFQITKYPVIVDGEPQEFIKGEWVDISKRTLND